MNNKTNLYLALSASLMTFTCIWAATSPPPTDPNSIPFSTDRLEQPRLIGWRQGTVETVQTFPLKVGITDANDAITLTVTTDVGTLTFGQRTRVGADVVDTYVLSHVRGVPITQYAHITVTCPKYGTSDTRTVAFNFLPKPTPVIFVQAVPMLDPNYDYTQAKTDPREHQKAIKHTQRWWYLTGQSILYNVRF